MGSLIVNYYRKKDDKDEHIPKVRAHPLDWNSHLTRDLEGIRDTFRPSAFR